MVVVVVTGVEVVDSAFEPPASHAVSNVSAARHPIEGRQESFKIHIGCRQLCLTPSESRPGSPPATVEDALTQILGDLRGPAQ
jgi:hypothetical protein